MSRRSEPPGGRIEVLRSDRGVPNREVPDDPCLAALIGVLAPGRDLLPDRSRIGMPVIQATVGRGTESDPEHVQLVAFSEVL